MSFLMRTTAILLFILAPLLAQAKPQSEPPPAAGKRVALVVGNSDYPGSMQLANPVNDARAICTNLQKLGFQTVCRENVRSKGAFKDAVREFTGKLSAQDTALFYFAGHGVEVDGENYLIPVASDIRKKSDFDDEALRVNYVLEELSSVKARLNIIILDACRDNPFGTRSRSTTSKGLVIPQSMPTGSVIIFPTAPGRTALDGIGSNGLFTSHLLANLHTPGQTLEEMFKQVILGVKTDAEKMGQEQIPWMNMSFTGEFCFAGCGTRVTNTQFSAVLEEKTKLEQAAQKLQNELASRQSEIKQYRDRMDTLQRQIQDQSKTSKSSLDRLGKEREELARKMEQLQAQEDELRKAKDELAKFEKKQAEYEQREKDILAYGEKIQELERKLVIQEERRLTSQEAEKIKKERDDLIQKNAVLQTQQTELEKARQELTEMQSRLQEIDKQKLQMDEFKKRLASLEHENRDKDAELKREREKREAAVQEKLRMEQAAKDLQGELGARQAELAQFKERMASLQKQLENQQTNSRTPSAEVERLTREREELLRKTEQLQSQEQQLREARANLARFEERQAEFARREKEMSQAATRISELERQLQQESTRKLPQLEADKLKREREELVNRNQELQRQQEELENARKELAKATANLREFDRQKEELESYKKKMAGLEIDIRQKEISLRQERERRIETEEKLKDAGTSTVKGAATVAPAF